MNDLSNNNTKILKLNGLLNYQTGAVVSKVLLKKITGNISVFAFDKGEGLSEHTATYDAFIQLLEGEAEIIISGNNYLLIAGDSIILPANEPHSVSAVTRFKMMLVMLKS